MYNILETYEHSTIESFSEEELISLIKDCPQLIENIDIKALSATTGYFIGLQWLADTGKVLYVKPKLDKHSKQTHFLNMLGFCLQHPEVYLYTDELFRIDFSKKQISIEQESDLITPLIIVQFLSIVHNIVKSGLRKGYYKVERNIKSTVRGKIMVGKTIKRNHLKNKTLHTYCTFENFGVNIPDNKLLKKSLEFVTRYTKQVGNNNINFSAVLNFITPAFEKVDADIDIHNVHYDSNNPFFKNYKEAIRLAKIILKRFGYHLSSIEKQSSLTVPPFWIDMSKLFELYVLGKLKEAIELKNIIFQAKGEYGNLDFLKTEVGKELVIDAKYKLDYKHGKYNIDDIRQISAYARDKGILNKMPSYKTSTLNPLVNCIIIYPDDNCAATIDSEKIFSNQIKEFQNFYKIGIALPTKTNSNENKEN